MPESLHGKKSLLTMAEFIPCERLVAIDVGRALIRVGQPVAVTIPAEIVGRAIAIRVRHTALAVGPFH